MGPRGGDRRSGAGQPKGASRATRPATATPPSPAPSGGRAPKGATTPTPWRLRFSARIIDEDLDDIGRAAFDVAMAAIDKKLRVDPHQYGDGLGPPLAGLIKLKASHVRIAYHVVDDAHEVWVLMLGDRQDIWKRREGDILERLATVKTRIVDEARRRSAAVEKKAPRPRHGGGGKGAR